MIKNKAVINCLVFCVEDSKEKSVYADIIIVMIVVRKNKENGFTIVELMVVVLILGILMVAAIPTYLGARDRAQVNVAKQALANSSKAAAAYYIDALVLPDADQMEDELSSYDYVDGAAAEPASQPPTIVVNDGYHIITGADSSRTVLKIDVSDGEIGSMTTGNP